MVCCQVKSIKPRNAKSIRHIGHCKENYRRKHGFPFSWVVSMPVLLLVGEPRAKIQLLLSNCFGHLLRPLQYLFCSVLYGLSLQFSNILTATWCQIHSPLPLLGGTVQWRLPYSIHFPSPLPRPPPSPAFPSSPPLPSLSLSFIKLFQGLIPLEWFLNSHAPGASFLHIWASELSSQTSQVS